MPAGRTAVLGVSAGGELALAQGLRRPDVYGAVFCASPGAGYRPPAVMPSPLPRAYFVAGTLEPFFHENATRWAVALREAGADVIMTERAGSHGGAATGRWSGRPRGGPIFWTVPCCRHAISPPSTRPDFRFPGMMWQSSEVP